MKKEQSFLIAAAAAWCAGFIAASFIRDAWLLHAFYSPVCHQFDSRTFHIGSEPMAVCGRCAGIYSGFLLGLIAVRLSQRVENIHIAPMRLLIISIVPAVLSVVVETTGAAAVTTLVRFLTGIWLGAGFSILLHRSLTDSIHSFMQPLKEKYEFKTR